MDVCLAFVFIDCIYCFYLHFHLLIGVAWFAFLTARCWPFCSGVFEGREGFKKNTDERNARQQRQPTLIGDRVTDGFCGRHFYTNLPKQVDTTDTVRSRLQWVAQCHSASLGEHSVIIISRHSRAHTHRRIHRIIQASSSPIDRLTHGGRTICLCVAAGSVVRFGTSFLESLRGFERRQIMLHWPIGCAWGLVRGRWGIRWCERCTLIHFQHFAKSNVKGFGGCVYVFFLVSTLFYFCQSASEDDKLTLIFSTNKKSNLPLSQRTKT